MKFRSSTILLALVSVLAGVAAGEPQLSGTLSELQQAIGTLPGVASIPGAGEVRSEADRAVLSLTLEVEKDTMKEAMETSRKIREEIATRLAGQGVSPDAVHWQRFSSSIKTGFFSSKAKSHTVMSTVKVTVGGEAQIETVAGLVDEYKDRLRVDGITFDHSRREELRREAVQKALANAEAARAVYEETLGVRLVPRAVHGAEQTEPALVMETNLRAEYSQARMAMSVAPPPGVTEARQFAELVWKANLVVEYTVVPDSRQP